MTITLSLSPETGTKLRERAATTGKDVPTLIREAVEEKLASEGKASLPSDLPYDRWKVAFD
jgi:predicted DNA-binding protein